MARQYEDTHPWITFDLRGINDVVPRLWMLLGEARSKCEHLAGTPLTPEVADQLNMVTLIKGAVATAAIEGNTLSEEQVAGMLKGTYTVPASRHYQEVEMRNVVAALERIDEQVDRGEYPKLTVELVRDFNRQVLTGVRDDPDDDARPGEVRTHSVTVGSYRGAPAEDCEYLLGRLCDWLEGPDFQNPDDLYDFALMLVRAVVAHLYIAWIHPFGDGNGRTARLIEYVILARSGKVPLPAAHLLSNHYNLTRDQYYRELDRASRTGGDIKGFVSYAIEGFVDGIREELRTVRGQQMAVAWGSYVREVLTQFPPGKVIERQEDVVRSMLPGVWYSRTEIESLSASLARQYGRAGDRTLARDLNRLVDVGLLQRDATRFRYTININRLAAFLPRIGREPNGGDA